MQSAMQMKFEQEPAFGHIEPRAVSSFAVLLNANARQVSREVCDALRRVVNPRDLFLSRDAREASAIAETVIGRRYGAVFTGGGDGTFVGWVNQILDRTERRALPAPRFGVMALGTGNAMAEVVGARPLGHLEELGAYARGEARRTRRLDLLVCRGRRTPFAGVGLDAAILNDYAWLKTWAKEKLGRSSASAVASGLSGYALAVALRSLPRHLRERRPAYCELVNLGRPAYRLDARGRQLGQAVATGDLLYAGPCALAAASTVPYYGFGLKAFPFADTRPGSMQLRLATELPVASLLWHLPRVWAGEFSHPALLDFHAERVGVRFERPVPSQVGGDAEGWVDEVEFALSPKPVELVDFAASARRPRLVS